MAKDKGKKSKKDDTKAKGKKSEAIDDDFADPSAGGDRFDKDAHEGKLLAIRVNRYEPEVQTSNGASDVVVCDVYVLTNKKGKAIAFDEVEEFEDAFIFGKVLISSLKQYAGRSTMVLAKLARGVAKPGQSAPWVLETADEDERDIAKAWTKSRRASNPLEA